jgi:hypothetical protein
MTFTYNQTIPAGPNNPSNDQPVMLANALSIYNIENVDHFGFNLPNGGTHKQVTLTSEETPAIPTGANAVLFSQFLINQDFPFWKNGTKTYTLGLQDPTQSNVTTNGYLSVGFGLILQWGQAVTIAGGITPVTFPLKFPGAVFSVVASRAQNQTSDTSYGVGLLEQTGFTFFDNSGASGAGILWIAVGN